MGKAHFGQLLVIASWNKPMIFKRILCPVDFSEYSDAANQYSTLFAKASGATIVYFHVWIPDAPYGSYVHLDVTKEQLADKERLEQIKPTDPNVKAEYVIEFGDPAQCVVDYAKDHEIDLIIMPTHGRTGISRALMGSVTEAVVRRAECPVLAIKPKSNVEEPTS